MPFDRRVDPGDTLQCIQQIRALGVECLARIGRNSVGADDDLFPGAVLDQVFFNHALSFEHHQDLPLWMSGPKVQMSSPSSRFWIASIVISMASRTPLQKPAVLATITFIFFHLSMGGMAAGDRVPRSR